MNKIKKKCKWCHKEFWVYPYRKDIAKFCSFKCYWKSKKGKTAWNKGIKIWWKGHTEKHSQKAKDKMSKAHKGLPSPMGMLGKKHTKEWRIKMSKRRKGKNSPSWKGGITSINKIIRTSLEYKFWREAVFERDDYTCWICEKRDGGILHPHHLKRFSEYPKLRFIVSNGLTLCEFCHRTYTKWGNKK